MPRQIQQPDASGVVTQTEKKATELYLCKVSNSPLALDDIVERTSGPLDVMPTRRGSRLLLHSGLSIFSAGNLEGGENSFQLNQSATDPKCQELLEAFWDGEQLLGNAFFFDDEGVAFTAYVTNATAVTDPNDDGSYWTFTIQHDNHSRIPASLAA